MLASSSLLVKVVKEFGSLNKQILLIFTQQGRLVPSNTLVKLHVHPLSVRRASSRVSNSLVLLQKTQMCDIPIHICL